MDGTDRLPGAVGRGGLPRVFPRRDDAVRDETAEDVLRRPAVPHRSPEGTADAGGRNARDRGPGRRERRAPAEPVRGPAVGPSPAQPVISTRCAFPVSVFGTRTVRTPLVRSALTCSVSEFGGRVVR